MENADPNSDIQSPASLHCSQFQSQDILANSDSTSFSLSQASGNGSNPRHSSMSHSLIDLNEVDENGKLDLSGRRLTALTGVKKDEEGQTGSRPKITQLIISRNVLRALDCTIVSLDKCIEIDASHNEFIHLRSFAPLSHTLVHLNLCDNRISSVGSLNSFLHLHTLDLSHNRIENFPSLDHLTQLSILKLGSNHLRTVPNLSKLVSLLELDLHGNSISSLESISSQLPVQSLRFLDLNGNLIDDLTEFHNLHGFCSLESLTVLGNPCTQPFYQKFSYRPFIYSCVLGFGDLKLLDGCFLSEAEILKGEWLHAQGRTRSFRPNTKAHVQLCAYLEIECPLLAEVTSILDSERMKKVVQKRREYNRSQSAVAADDTSLFWHTALGADDTQFLMNVATGKKLKEATNQEKSATPKEQQKTTPRSAGQRANSRNAGEKGTPKYVNERRPTPGRKLAEGGQRTAERSERSRQGTPKNVGNRANIGSSRGKANSESTERPPLRRINFSSAKSAESTPTIVNARWHQTANERSHSSIDSYDQARTDTKVVTNQHSPARTVVLTKGIGDVLGELFRPNDQLQMDEGNLNSARPSDFHGSQSQLPVGSSALSPLSSRDFGGYTRFEQPLFASSNQPFGASLRDNATGTTAAESSSRTSNKTRKKNRFQVLARKFHIKGSNNTKKNKPQQHSSGASLQQSPGTVIRNMQRKIDQLAANNEHLMAVNEDHVMTFHEMGDKIQQLYLEMAKTQEDNQQLRAVLVPTPTNMTYKYTEEGGKNFVDIGWENAMPMDGVKCYELSLNERPYDQMIIAKNRRLRIIDLNRDKETKISIHAISSAIDGLRSKPAEIMLPKFNAADEEKENSNGNQQ